MTEEKKKIVEYKDGKVMVKFDKEFDFNNDGEPVLKMGVNVELDVMEIPEEAYAMWKAKKEEK